MFHERFLLIKCVLLNKLEVEHRAVDAYSTAVLQECVMFNDIHACQPLSMCLLECQAGTAERA